MTDDEDRNDQQQLHEAKRARSNDLSDSMDPGRLFRGGGGGLDDGMGSDVLRLHMQRRFPPGSSAAAAAANELLMRQYNQMFNPSWMDLMIPYFARNPYHQQLGPQHAPPSQMGHAFLPMVNHHPQATLLPAPMAPQISPTESIPESDRSSAFSVTQPLSSEDLPPVRSSPAPRLASRASNSDDAPPSDQRDGNNDDNKKVNFSIASILLL